MVVGANHYIDQCAVVPELKRRTHKLVELFRAGCVSAGNAMFRKWYLREQMQVEWYRGLRLTARLKKSS